MQSLIFEYLLPDIYDFFLEEALYTCALESPYLLKKPEVFVCILFEGETYK